MKKNSAARTAKDSDIVAHVVSIPNAKKSFIWGENQYTLIAILLNKYGWEIGCICRDIETGRIVTMDPWLYDEFICEENGGVFYS